jgi:hypothetical protein
VPSVTSVIPRDVHRPSRIQGSSFALLPPKRR